MKSIKVQDRKVTVFESHYGRSSRSLMTNCDISEVFALFQLLLQDFVFREEDLESLIDTEGGLIESFLTKAIFG